MRAALAILILALGLAPAAAETIVASLSTSQVRITSNYTGSQIVVFGVIERDAQSGSRVGGYDVVVTVRGPSQALTVREKQRLGPIWINREQQKFVRIPAYLGVFSSAPIREVTADTLRRRLRLGVDAVVNDPEVTLDRGELDEPFREALVRLRTRELLFVEDERGVTFLTPTLFRTAIPLPANAPPGGYAIEIALFSDDVLLSRAQAGFEVVKTGFEQHLAELATDWSFVYGAGTALAALLFGWVANAIFRRD